MGFLLHWEMGATVRLLVLVWEWQGLMGTDYSSASQGVWDGIVLVHHTALAISKLY